MSDVLVVGCGLLGTSVALALRDSPWADVTLADADPAHVATAVSRGAGRRWDGEERALLVVAAVPPGRAADVLIGLQRRDVGLTYTHVSSVQSHVQAEIEAQSPDPSRVVGGHPLAGREVSGPDAAVADLFVGRPWAVCATPGAAPDAVDAVRLLATTCAAVPVDIDPDAHDRAVALLSHLPQVAASALAAQLAPPGPGPGAPTVLAGPGLADTTRLAAADPGLWTDILAANAEHLAPLVAGLASTLQELAQVLQDAVEATPDARPRLAAFLQRGNAGRATIPVKRGELAEAFGRVRVVLPDRAGELASLLVAAGKAGVNVEDVRVEHVPGRPTGVVELLVESTEAGRLREGLQLGGWQLT